MLNIKDGYKDSRWAALPKMDSWTLPDFDSLKFNVDGATRGSLSPAGIGGVLRAHNGKVLFSFSSYVGHLCAETAEVMAILRACQLCASQPNLIAKNIFVISDSSSEVAWVNDSDIRNLHHLNFILEIRH
ncbi:hypothetical protein QYF36_004528 [Acer negundo]|nr:hypothetical protein QYF36_004528 [Acer negundo]